MSLATTKKISLDFYNNNYVVVNAKQLDTDTRFINVTCTDYGKKVTLDRNSMSAFIRYNKSDGNYVFNDAIIEADGTITIELTQQMLAASGKQSVDVLILASDNISIDDINDTDKFYKLGIAVISTMTFYINVSASAIDHTGITSSDEYDALTNTLAKVIATEKLVEKNETKRQDAEVQRQESLQLCDQATENANSATNSCIAATTEANQVTTDARNFLDHMQNLDETLQKATDAAALAEEAVAKCEGFADTVDKVNEMTQATDDENVEFPVLFSNSNTPVDGSFTGTYYNTGITINPNKKSITIGDAILAYENVDNEKRLVISFN